ncbi:gp53-like domain-containing protein [Phascolarctobacterium faecium]|uniref:gp53-like domain-containing protein n=1 Tax=Phascolarctobacterium faecium TaxID=33025 RepID=UPI003C6E4A8F
MNNAILDTLNGGIWLQTSNGVKFLIQFGYFFSTSTSSEKTVVWPVAFPSHLINVQTLPYAPSGQTSGIIKLRFSNSRRQWLRNKYFFLLVCRWVLIPHCNPRKAVPINRLF